MDIEFNDRKICRFCGGDKCGVPCDAKVTNDEEKRCDKINPFGYRCIYNKDHSPSYHYFIGSPSFIRINDDLLSKISNIENILEHLLHDMDRSQRMAGDVINIRYIETIYRLYDKHSNRHEFDKEMYEKTVGLIKAFLSSMIVERT